MTPTSLADAIAVLPDLQEVREGPNFLIFQSALAGTDVRAFWTGLLREPPSFLTSIVIEEAVTGLEWDAGAAPVAGERQRITLRKRVESETVRLFRTASLGTLWDEIARARMVLVADMGPDQSFRTLGARYQMWTLDAPPTFAPIEPLPDPRRLVKDFTGRHVVPSDVRPWLLQTPPIEPAAVFEAWSLRASTELLASLCDQVALHEGKPRYHFSGPPAVAVAPTNQEFLQAATGLQEAGTWVFAEGRDAEARHTLLATEWARAYQSEEFALASARGLTSAKPAYAAYLKSGSKETLKALADLRKAVVEETQKASQKAQELSGGLWKDLAVAAAPFVLKVLPDTAKVASNVTAGWLTFGAALFLAYSYLMQIYINANYFRQQSDGRVVWRATLNSVLSADELDAFSEKPIRDSIRDYRTVRNVIGAIYLILVIILLAFAFRDLQKLPNA